MWDDRWLSGLERVLLVLFALTVFGQLVMLLDWWEGIWRGVGVAFVVALVVYSFVGGVERMSSTVVGTVSLVLLGLSVLANIADAFVEMDSPGWRLARGVVSAGFAVCFAVYLIVRYRQRHRTPYPD